MCVSFIAANLRRKALQKLEHIGNLLKADRFNANMATSLTFVGFKRFQLRSEALLQRAVARGNVIAILLDHLLARTWAVAKKEGPSMMPTLPPGSKMLMCLARRCCGRH